MYFLLLILSFISIAQARHSISNDRLDQLSGDQEALVDNKTKWDQRYSKTNYIYGKTPAEFLAKNFDYFKKNSKILDIGAGEGRNAVFLAKKGHNVLGVDISSVALRKAKYLAKEMGVRIKTLETSVDRYNFIPGSFDAIICFYYVNKDLVKKMLTWLRPGGIIIFEAYTEGHPDVKSGGKSKNETVASQELLSWFKDQIILKYEEPHHTKAYTASIIVQKK